MLFPAEKTVKNQRLSSQTEIIQYGSQTGHLGHDSAKEGACVVYSCDSG
jgi:hypothetical protein